MDVHIGELTSTVHAVDDDAALSPAAMERLVAAVLRAVEASQAHRERVRAERRFQRGPFEAPEED